MLAYPIETTFCCPNSVFISALDLLSSLKQHGFAFVEADSLQDAAWRRTVEASLQFFSQDLDVITNALSFVIASYCVPGIGWKHLLHTFADLLKMPVASQLKKQMRRTFKNGKFVGFSMQPKRQFFQVAPPKYVVSSQSLLSAQPLLSATQSSLRIFLKQTCKFPKQ